VTHLLQLQDYAPEEPTLVGVGIWVWVDPSTAILEEFDTLNKGYGQVLDKLGTRLGKTPNKNNSAGNRLLTWLNLLSSHDKESWFKSATENYRRSLNAWYARLWSQHPDVSTHWTVNELQKINDENPRFYEWLCISSWSLIERHRMYAKKGYQEPSKEITSTEGPGAMSLVDPKPMPRPDPRPTPAPSGEI
jgi:hypothetical protein